MKKLLPYCLMLAVLSCQEVHKGSESSVSSKAPEQATSETLSSQQGSPTIRSVSSKELMSTIAQDAAYSDVLDQEPGFNILPNGTSSFVLVPNEPDQPVMTLYDPTTKVLRLAVLSVQDKGQGVSRFSYHLAWSTDLLATDPDTLLVEVRDVVGDDVPEIVVYGKDGALSSAQIFMRRAKTKKAGDDALADLYRPIFSGKDDGSFLLLEQPGEEKSFTVQFDGSIPTGSQVYLSREYHWDPKKKVFTLFQTLEQVKELGWRGSLRTKTVSKLVSENLAGFWQTSDDPSFDKTLESVSFSSNGKDADFFSGYTVEPFTFEAKRMSYRSLELTLHSIYVSPYYQYASLVFQNPEKISLSLYFRRGMKPFWTGVYRKVQRSQLSRQSQQYQVLTSPPFISSLRSQFTGDFGISLQFSKGRAYMKLAPGANFSGSYAFFRVSGKDLLEIHSKKGRRIYSYKYSRSKTKGLLQEVLILRPVTLNFNHVSTQPLRVLTLKRSGYIA